MTDPSPTVRLVPHAALEAFASAVFERLGVPAADAGTVARSLVLADLTGVATHGLARLPACAAAW